MSEAVIIMILQYGLKYGPEAAKAVRALFTKKDPTNEDWDALWLKTKEKWVDYVPPTQ